MRDYLGAALGFGLGLATLEGCQQTIQNPHNEAPVSRISAANNDAGTLSDTDFESRQGVAALEHYCILPGETPVPRTCEDVSAKVTEILGPFSRCQKALDKLPKPLSSDQFGAVNYALAGQFERAQAAARIVVAAGAEDGVCKGNLQKIVGPTQVIIEAAKRVKAWERETIKSY